MTPSISINKQKKFAGYSDFFLQETV